LGILGGAALTGAYKEVNDSSAAMHGGNVECGKTLENGE